MIKKKILICSSNELGENIYKLLKDHKCKMLTSNIEYKKKGVVYVNSKSEFLKSLLKIKKFDFIILVYWPFIIPKNYFSKFDNSINFHPSLLPNHRGWYPHVHAKINYEKWGVSLHQIDNGIDTGDIWIQKPIKINIMWDNKKIYQIAKKELFKLFKNNYKEIFSGKIKPKSQKIIRKFLKKKDALKYDVLPLNSKINLKNFINLCLARSWGNKSFLKIIHKNEKYKIFLKIQKIRQ